MQRWVAVLLSLLSLLTATMLVASEETHVEAHNDRAGLQSPGSWHRAITHEYKLLNSAITVLDFTEDGHTFSYSYKLVIPGQISYTYTENKIPYALLKGATMWGDYVALLCRDKACIHDSQGDYFTREIIRFRNEKAARQASDYFNRIIQQVAKE